MLARVQVPLPFNMLVEANQQFIVPTYQKKGYTIKIFPPVRDPTMASNREPASFKMNDKEALLCNTIILQFFKREFDRPVFKNKEKTEISDPPVELINETLNHFLMRLRWVAESPFIHSIDIQRNGWKIDYINDDEKPLPPDDKIYGDLHFAVTGNYPKINQEIWLEAFFSPYVPKQRNWEDFTLDAYDVLPQVGLSIMLANIAIEIFILNILNQLAEEKGISDYTWWQWISNRKKNKDPYIEDQYDGLLKILSGHSLKEDNRLWGAFTQLRNARNNFVHAGIARIGSNEPLTENQTIELLQKMDEIFLKIRTWLPDKMQWELPKKRKFKIEFGIQIVNIPKTEKTEK
jgi:hypothetical protein